MSAVDYQATQQALNAHAAYADMDAGFWPLFNACRSFTMTSVERMYDLYKTVEYIARCPAIRGAIVETGVWRGGSMMLAAYTLIANGDTGRDIYLFDTFEGHPKPDPEADVDIWGHAAAADWHEGWGRVDEAEVRSNMLLTGYPAERIKLVKGMVEDTIASLGLAGLALVRLDTDWYAGTKAALDYCWPGISPGGVLIVDDYGHYRGQRQAVDEYFADRSPVKLTRVDYACRSIVKG